MLFWWLMEFQILSNTLNVVFFFPLICLLFVFATGFCCSVKPSTLAVPDCLLPALVVSLSGLFFSHVEDHALIVYPNSSDTGDISHIPVQTTRNAKKPETASAEMAWFFRAPGRGDNKKQEGQINIGVDT